MTVQEHQPNANICLTEFKDIFEYIGYYRDHKIIDTYIYYEGYEDDSTRTNRRTTKGTE